MKEEWKKEKVRSPIREGRAPMSCSCNSPNSLTALQCRPYSVSWTLNFSLTHYFSRFPVTYFLHMVYSSFDFFFWSCFPAESHEWQWHWKVFILLSSALWLTPFRPGLSFTLFLRQHEGVAICTAVSCLLSSLISSNSSLWLQPVPPQTAALIFCRKSSLFDIFSHPCVCSSPVCLWRVKAMIAVTS